MLTRLWSLFCAILAVVVVLSAGWLTTSHDRLGGIAVLALGGLMAYHAFKPRRVP